MDKVQKPISLIQQPSSEPFRIFWGSLSFVTTTEELLRRIRSGSGLEAENSAVGGRHADSVAPCIRKSWH
jgi:hypothetical protein